MKKRLLSFLLTLVMIMSMIPGAAFAAEDKYYVSIEDYTNTFDSQVLTVNSSSNKVTDVIGAALGGTEKIHLWNDGNKTYPTGFEIGGRWFETASGQSVQPMQEGIFWAVSIKHSASSRMFHKMDNPDKYDFMSPGDVVRLMYTDDGGEAVTGRTDLISGFSNGSIQNLPSKDNLVRQIADQPNHPNHDLAMSVLLNPKATEEDIQNAFTSKSTPAESVTLSNKDSVLGPDETLTLEMNGELILSAKVLPEGATEPLSWSNSAEEAVTLTDNKDGTATIRPLQVGDAVITASAGSASAQIKVRVPEIKAQTVILSADGRPVSEPQTLELTRTIKLTAAVEPAGTSDVLNWSVSGNAVTVKDGLITAMEKGEATVTATAGAASASVTFIVDDIKITDIQDVNMLLSDSKKVSITPKDATQKVDRWEIKPAELATIDSNGKITPSKEGTGTISAFAGDKTFTADLTISQGPHVVFETNDGQTIKPDEEGVFHLSPLIEGKFILKNAELEPMDGWVCAEEIVDDQGDRFTHNWINAQGVFQPLGTKIIDAHVVTLENEMTTIGRVDFKISNESSNITALKTYVDNVEVSAEKPLITEGTSATGKVVVTKGLKDGQWITVPNQALKFGTNYTDGAIRINDGKIHMGASGDATLTVSLKENPGIHSSFSLGSKLVPVESITVEVYKVNGQDKIPLSAENPFLIDVWNSLAPYYVGIQPNGNITYGYKVNFTPANASNKEVTWTALTPEIGTHMVEFDNGIIPGKAGVAQYTVTSKANPNATANVEVHFEYKDKLTSVALQESEIQLGVGASKVLDLTYNPTNATEHRIKWTADTAGIADIKSEVVNNKNVKYTVIAKKEGVVTFTGKPFDNTASAITLKVTVGQGGGAVTAPDKATTLATAKEDIAHGLTYLNGQAKNAYDTEWTLFTLLRSGKKINPSDQLAWEQAIKAKLDSGTLAPNVYVRFTLVLGAMGYNPGNWEGYNLYEKMYNHPDLANSTSNMLAWTLIALDTQKYNAPNNALWNRDRLIRELAQFQCEDGSFGLSKSDKTGSIDMTAMVMQALAPYINDSRDTKHVVKGIYDKGLAYLQDMMTTNCGFIAEGGENSCSAAQVLIALVAAGIDPLDPANGFTFGEKSIVSNLHQFRRSGPGYELIDGQDVAILKAGEQVTHALEAYRRFAENGKYLFDYSDVTPLSETPRGKLEAAVSSAASLKQADYTSDTWAAFDTAKKAAVAALEDPNTSDENLTSALNTLNAAIKALKPKDGVTPPKPAEKTVTVTFRLIGSKLVEEGVDLSANSRETKSLYMDWITPRSYTLPEGSTVYDLTMMALSDAGLGQQGADTNYISTVYAPSVYGGYELSEFTNGPRSGWMFLTNGRHGGFGLKEQELKNGQKIVWHYVNDFAYEVHDWAGPEGQGDSSTYIHFDQLPVIPLPSKPVNPNADPSAKPDKKPVEEETKKETKPDGTVVETTTRTDGSSTVVETQKDGTITTTDVNVKGDETREVKKPDGSSKTDIKMKDGSTSTTKVDKDGKTEAEVKVPEKVFEQAAREEKSVELPIPAVSVTRDQDKAPVIKIDAGKAEDITVKVPVKDVTPGTVAVIVHKDGTEEIVRKTAGDKDGVIVPLEAGATIKILDNSKKFDDPIADWSRDAVDFVTSHDLFKGTSDTTFDGAAPMNRAMLATVLWRLENETKSAVGNVFEDVAEGQWYTDAISWAAENKIVTGTGDGFAPNAPITREQLATMMFRYADTMKLDTRVTGDLSKFTDSGKTSGWAADAMKWAVSVGLIGGKGNDTLDPAGTATRAEVAIICQRMVELMAR